MQFLDRMPLPEREGRMWFFTESQKTKKINRKSRLTAHIAHCWKWARKYCFTWVIWLAQCVQLCVTFVSDTRRFSVEYMYWHMMIVVLAVGLVYINIKYMILTFFSLLLPIYPCVPRVCIWISRFCSFIWSTDTLQIHEPSPASVSGRSVFCGDFISINLHEFERISLLAVATYIVNSKWLNYSTGEFVWSQLIWLRRL